MSVQDIKDYETYLHFAHERKELKIEQLSLWGALKKDEAGIAYSTEEIDACEDKLKGAQDEILAIYENFEKRIEEVSSAQDKYAAFRDVQWVWLDREFDTLQDIIRNIEL